MARKTATLRFWQFGFLALAMLGCISISWLLSSPSEQAASILLGYSARRLVLALLLALPSVVLTWIGLQARRYASQLASLEDRLRKLAIGPSLGLCMLLEMLGLAGVLLPQDRAIALVGPLSLYLEQLRPLLLFVAGVGVVALGLLLVAHYGWHPERAEGSAVLRPALWILAAFLAALAIIALTRLGLGFDATIWNAPGTPLLFTQVLLAVAAAAGLLLTASRFGRNWRRLDLLLASLVWLLAAAMWLQQPAEPTYYSSTPRPPNFESYPVSDAFNHDTIAQSVLIGQGFHFGGLVAVRRPLYVMLLAGLEALFGPSYANVVNAQVVLLALFPALLYLLGARLHSRFAGLIVAGTVILRETNSIALGHVINASHAKLLMADLPTALAMAALGLAAVAWLHGSPRNGLAALGVGGLLGAFVLLRSQTLTLIPVFLLLILLVWGWRQSWKPALLFMLAILLVAGPWVVRNRIGMGQWAIEDSIVSGFLANRYRYEPGTFGLPFQVGETEGEYYARQMGAVRAFALSDPLYVAGFVADNFVRNQLLNFMALPPSFELRDLEAYVRQLPYWPSWDGSLPMEGYLPVVLNLSVVSLGLAVAWKKYRWVGLVPLFMLVGFTANLALARVSGWRYNLPIDWVVMLYFAVGLAQVLIWARQLFANKAPNLSILYAPEPSSKHEVKNGSRLALAAAALLLAGCSFSLIEAFSQPKFAKLDAAAVLAELDAVASSSQLDSLRSLLAGRGLDIVNGRALYPTFYAAGEGEAESNFALTGRREFARITFFLIGPENASVVLPFDEKSAAFPSGTHAILLRCDANSDPLAVVLPEQEQVLFSSEFALGCAK